MISESSYGIVLHNLNVVFFVCLTNEGTSEEYILRIKNLTCKMLQLIIKIWKPIPVWQRRKNLPMFFSPLFPTKNDLVSQNNYIFNDVIYQDNDNSQLDNTARLFPALFKVSRLVSIWLHVRLLGNSLAQCVEVLWAVLHDQKWEKRCCDSLPSSQRRYVLGSTLLECWWWHVKAERDLLLHGEFTTSKSGEKRDKTFKIIGKLFLHIFRHILSLCEIKCLLFKLHR